MQLNCCMASKFSSPARVIIRFLCTITVYMPILVYSDDGWITEAGKIVDDRRY
jgi:hypothetical protein